MRHPSTLDLFGSPTVAAWAGPEAPAVLGAGLEDPLRAVLWAWAAQGAHATQTMARMGEIALRFTRRLTVTGIATWPDVTAEDCEAFVLARGRAGLPPSVQTQHFRRVTLRTIYRTLRALGAPVGDPTLDLALPPRGPFATRPLTDDEITLLRTAAATVGRRRSAPAALALAEATAMTSEIPHLRVGHLDDPAAPTTVALPGTSRCAPRLGTLSPWGRRALAARATGLLAAGAGPEVRLAYQGQARPGSVGPQASACNQIGILLAATGLDREPDVRPSSVRQWAARALYDQGVPIDEVARRLGANSLDRAAEAIGLDWQPSGVRSAR